MLLQPGDIGEALAWFTSKTGQEAELIILNPKNEHLAGEVADGIKVEFVGGVLRGEVWLSAADTFVTQELATDFSEDYEWGKRNKSNIRPVVPFGRPKRDLPMEKIVKLRAEGLGARAIAKRLQAEGIEVSFMTIYRAMKKEE